MTVAYPHLLTTPTKADIFNAINTAVGKRRAMRPKEQERWITLSLPLPPIDLLAALVELQTNGHEFYWESPQLAEGLAAAGIAAQWTGSGRDRFHQAQQVADSWFARTQDIALGTSSGLHVLCRFTFADGDRHHLQVEEQPCSATAAPCLIIPRWQVTRCRATYRFTATLCLSDLGHTSAVEVACDNIWRCYTNLRQMAVLPQLDIPNLRSSARPVALRASPFREQQFLSSVKALLTAIERRHLTKVVLASALDLTHRSSFSAVTALRLLRHRHSGCHIFATRYGDQLFLGASPERLFRIRRQRLSADAIAGSSPRGSTAAADHALGETLRHSEKELHEHQIVAHFIAGQLRQLGLKPSWSPHPQILRLANIQHLHTPLTAQVPANIHPLQIVASLHPTPAVAGLPQRAACDAIAEHEPFERSLYAAPLGWISQQRDCEFIVGIRSALIDETRIRLYAGAGIVQGSVPAREWAEVNMKLQAIASVLSLSDAMA